MTYDPYGPDPYSPPQSAPPGYGPPGYGSPGQQGYGPPGFGGTEYLPGYGAPGPGYARPTNGLAVASLIVSLVGLVLAGGLVGIVGALMGHAARRQIAERGEEGDGMALAGIIVGWISFGLGVVGLLFLLGFIALIGLGAAAGAALVPPF